MELLVWYPRPVRWYGSVTNTVFQHQRWYTVYYYYSERAPIPLRMVTKEEVLSLFWYKRLTISP